MKISRRALLAGMATAPLVLRAQKVFKDSGRSVPVINDKHLSCNWKWAKKMYDTSRSMGFPLMAGSSLPVTWRTPSIEMPLGARVREAVCVCYGGVDRYDFHGLETLQCMVERRRGGESGVKWLQEPHPVERTLLVSGVLESCLTSRLQEQKRLETPHLNVRYRAPRQSSYART